MSARGVASTNPNVYASEPTIPYVTFILFHCHLGHIPKMASSLSLAKLSPARSEERVHLDAWGTQFYYAVRSRVPRVRHMHVQYVCTAPHINRVHNYIFSLGPSWFQTKTETTIFFPPRLNDDAAWQTSPSLSPSSPTFVPLMMIDVGPNGLTRIWTHPPTPKPPFPRPGYFFPARPPVRSLSTSLYTAIQGCRQCSHPRATIATDQFFAPARQVPFTPSPVGSAPPSIADSFNSDNYGSINKKIVDSPPSFDFSVWFSLLEMGKFWNVDLPKRKKEKKKKKVQKIVGCWKTLSPHACVCVFLPSFCPHVPLRYIELRN